VYYFSCTGGGQTSTQKCSRLCRVRQSAWVITAVIR